MIRTLVALLLTTALLTSASPATAEDGAYPVDLIGQGDVFVDETHGHIFVTQISDRLIVFDLEGTTRRELPVRPLSHQMAYDPARGALWVGGEGGLSRVDLSTLAVTPIPLPAGTCAGGITVTLGLVWFAGKCYPEGGPGMAFNPATGKLTTFPSVQPGAFLTSSARRPGTIVSVHSFLHGHQAEFESYAVTGGANPTMKLVGSTHAVGASPEVALAPDGETFLSEDGVLYRSSDAARVGDVDVPGQQTAVAFRADGVAAIGGNGIRFYDGSSRTPVRTYLPSGAPDYWYDVAPGMIAFGARSLYAVSEGPSPSGWTIRVITLKERAGVDIATDQRHYRQGQEAVVTATLERGVVNRTLDIYAERSKSGDRVLIASGRVNAQGALTTRYPITDFTRFYAVYAGDEQTDAGSATVDAFVKTTVDLDVLRARRKVDGVHLFPVRGRAVFRATIRPFGPTNCVNFYLSARVRGKWYDAGNTKCLPVSSQGVVKAYLRGNPKLAGYLLSVSAYWYANDGTSKQTSSGARRLKFVR